MKKKLIVRAFVGAALGLTITNVISIVTSLIINDGHFYPVPPEMIQQFGNEMNAVMIQTVSSLFYGSIWAAASLIWEKENWSLTKQTIIHLIVCSVSTFPIAYFNYWTPHHIIGFVSYFLLFFVIYGIIWLSQYLSIKKHIKKINQKVHETYKQ